MSLVTEKKEEKKKQPKGPVREWVDAIVFAVIAATLIRWVAFEAYTIPTASMEKSLLVGDYLFVSKLHYGPRTPKTPLQIPLTHQKIWGTDINSYLDWIQLPQYRLPGFSEVKRNDVVVFNWPAEEGHPSDMKLNYIKRCIAVAGDSLKIINREVFVNGESADFPENGQYKYDLVTEQGLSKKVLKQQNLYRYNEYNVTDYNLYPGRGPADKKNYRVGMTNAQVENMEKLPFVDSATPVLEGSRPDIFPKSSIYNWSVDNFGTIYIPKEGDELEITPETLPFYKRMIAVYEGNDDVEFRDNKLFIEGNEVSTYKVKQNYYFMMGDNRHNSEDSRFWGFVPEDHIIGKAVLVWFSMDPNSEDGGVRWDRIFNVID